MSLRFGFHLDMACERLDPSMLKRVKLTVNRECKLDRERMLLIFRPAEFAARRVRALFQTTNYCLAHHTFVELKQTTSLTLETIIDR